MDPRVRMDPQYQPFRRKVAQVNHYRAVQQNAYRATHTVTRHHSGCPLVLLYRTPSRGERRQRLEIVSAAWTLFAHPASSRTDGE